MRPILRFVHRLEHLIIFSLRFAGVQRRRRSKSKYQTTQRDCLFVRSADLHCAAWTTLAVNQLGGSRLRVERATWLRSGATTAWLPCICFRPKHISASSAAVAHPSGVYVPCTAHRNCGARWWWWWRRVLTAECLQFAKTVSAGLRIEHSHWRWGLIFVQQKRGVERANERWHIVGSRLPLMNAHTQSLFSCWFKRTRLYFAANTPEIRCIYQR